MMTHELKRRTVYSAGIASLMLSVSFWIAPVALAKYTPPENPSKPKDTGTNTTRGGSCEANSSAKLTALVPFSHVGETISGYPDLYLVCTRSRSSFAAIPAVYSHGTTALQNRDAESARNHVGCFALKSAPTVDRAILSVASGFGLRSECSFEQCGGGGRNPSRWPEASLQTQLAAAQTPQQRIDLYAESGLWYDAIAEARKASETSQNQAAGAGIARCSR